MDDKARENKLRRLASQQGYALKKDRARSTNIDHYGGYMIVEVQANRIEAGEKFNLSLDEVEKFLKQKASHK